MYTDKWLDLEGAFVTYSLVAIWWQFFEFIVCSKIVDGTLYCTLLCGLIDICATSVS